ncbi:NACHT domain protein [Apiospora hydei]|uniref:NACHT domain protein n=1 Tax=Apiospora hydei TaxID=1337664 RepID=A0ABR1WPY5_9PEZI
MESVPDPDTIIVFTAELDLAHKNVRKGRSFSSGLYKFLSSTRDFCGVIDTYVSAHPEIAAFVWGSAKMTMLVLRIRRPLLYASDACFPASCGFIGQEFKPDLDNIQICANEVKEQISLAKAKFDAAQQQSLVRKVEMQLVDSKTVKRLLKHINNSTDTSSRNSQIQANMQRREHARELLKSLSTHDHLRTFKTNADKQYGNTTGWIFKTPEFKAWISGVTPVLWCSGKIGSGKTVASASAIQHVLRSVSNCTVTFLFIQPDDNNTLEAELALRSLLRQRLDEKTMSQDLANALSQVLISTGHSRTIGMLRDLMPATQDSFVFIDGLDECDRDERQELLKALQDLLVDRRNIHLYLSGRNGLRDDIQKYFPYHAGITLDCQETREGIATYIQVALDEKLRDRELKVGDPGLVGEIEKSLLKGSQGMYLWAYYQIKEICVQHCDEDIRRALENLPETLAELFERVLRRIKAQHHGPAAQKVFPWIVGAKRLLSIAELREAVAVEIGQEYTDTSRFYNDMEHVASWCESLVEVNLEDDLIQFAHSAVRSFLLGEPTDPGLKDFHLDLEASDHLLGETCVAYLNFNDFKTSLAIRPKPLLIDPSKIAHAAVRPGSKRAALLSVLGLTSTTEPVDLRAFKAFSPARRAGQVQHAFLDYASIYWIAHTKSFRKERSRDWTLWRSMLFERHTPAKIPWADEYTNENTEQGTGDIRHSGEQSGSRHDVHLPRVRDPMMIWAFKNEHYAIIRHLMSGEHRYRALLGAVESRKLKLVDMVINEMVAIRKLSGIEKQNALVLAAAQCETDIVDRLLAAGADINTPSEDWLDRTALWVAASRGHLEMVKHLLSVGADVNAASGYSGGNGPLQIAHENDHPHVVQFLLTAKADTERNPYEAMEYEGL